MLRTPLLLAVALLCAACASDLTDPPPAGAQHTDPAQETAAPTLLRERTPCNYPGVNGPAVCGTYSVYEDRDAGTGRTIDLAVVVLKARRPKPNRDPVVYFEGGPGGSAIDRATFFSDVLADVNLTRDLVFIDQRGTGHSGRLACDTPLPGGDASLFGSLFPDDHIQACAARLSADADLRHYTTPYAVDDIDEVLEWLGYDAVNLFGTSYGTRAALVYLRRHPERVRSVLLNGVAPPHINIHLHDAANVEAALNRLFSRCEENAACAAQYPNLRADFETLLARFEEGPVKVALQSDDGPLTTVAFSRDDFGYAVRGLLYGSLAEKIAPWTTEAVATNTWSGFPAYYVERSRWVASEFATGMHLSIFCSEDLPFMTEAQVAEATQGTFLGDFLIRRYERACKRWPRGAIPAVYHSLVSSEVPTLIISGERDPVTPATWGEEIRAALPNSRHIIVPDAGHVPLTPCVQSIQQAFINAGTVDGLDTACVGG